jgi:hypothetical protein
MSSVTLARSPALWLAHSPEGIAEICKRGELSRPRPAIAQVELFASWQENNVFNCWYGALQGRAQHICLRLRVLSLSWAYHPDQGRCVLELQAFTSFWSPRSRRGGVARSWARFLVRGRLKRFCTIHIPSSCRHLTTFSPSTTHYPFIPVTECAWFYVAFFSFLFWKKNTLHDTTVTLGSRLFLILLQINLLHDTNTPHPLTMYTTYNPTPFPHPRSSRSCALRFFVVLSDQASCLRRDHETRYYPYYSFYPRNPVYVRSLDPSVLAISLSLHRHPFRCILFSSRFTWYNKYELQDIYMIVFNSRFMY